MWDMVKKLGENLVALLLGLFALALLSKFGIPLGNYTWAWLAEGNNAMVLIAIGVLALGSGALSLAKKDA